MEIQIGLPDEDGLQKYRMFFEKTENIINKSITVKYTEWLQTGSGRIFDLSIHEYKIENTPDIYYNKGEIKEPEVLDEKGYLVKEAVLYDGTEIKQYASNIYDEFYQITNSEKSTALINETIANL